MKLRYDRSNEILDTMKYEFYELYSTLETKELLTVGKCSKINTIEGEI